MAFATGDDDAATRCRHCGGPLPVGDPGPFCCGGCEGAFALVSGLGLAGFYERRRLDAGARPLRPDERSADGLAALAQAQPDGRCGLELLVDGLHCAACAWLIEQVLAAEPRIERARVNLTERRLAVTWRGGSEDADSLLGRLMALGFRLTPYDRQCLADSDRAEERQLLRSMAVAGFAAANVMLFSVSVWAGNVTGIGVATRDLLHWLSALIALPAILYAGRPFYASALGALRHGRTNMDVPISLGVLLAGGMSLVETMRSGEHAYFDSACTLLFFLLIGRFLDRRARGKARAAAARLVSFQSASATLLGTGGKAERVPVSQLRPDDHVLVASGERLPADGVVIDGVSDIDTALVTGESLPQPVGPGARVYAGTVNLGAPLHIKVAAAGAGTLLAEIVQLMDAAERGRGRFVALADRVARRYAPVVHIVALATFLGWYLGAGMAWQDALMIAVAVLIITCPCALALAVPVVQVIASGRLWRQGSLLKSATALERLRDIDTVVFDKTGTLTLGRPTLLPGGWTEADLQAAAGLAMASRHPLARALVAAAPPCILAHGVIEHPGLGLSCGETRLGSRGFCGADGAAEEDTVGPELWFARPGRAPIRFVFVDPPRMDAAHVIAELRRRGLAVRLLSGDRAPAVAELAGAVDIADWQAGIDPAGKAAALAELRAAGRRVLMVGDGLNDAAALVAADASMSPASAVDISRTAADIVFQGDRLAPVIDAIDTARRADRLVRQNIALALLYNFAAVPLAIGGVVTPLIAAVAMSSSSILVILNALRLTRGVARGGRR